MSASALSRFQDAFARALRGEAESAVAYLASQPGFAVYRNTVLKACVDALAANFPAVRRLVGEAWMRAAAAVYARAHPPGDPRLMLYGERFPEFLAQFEPARELPYLADVARLDRAWCEAHVAVDAVPLCGKTIAALTADRLARLVLVPHPAARWRWFDHAPVSRIWRANRLDDASDVDLSALPWAGDGVLVTRPREAVEHALVDRATCAFLDVCAAGGSVAVAVHAAWQAEAEVDFVKLMATLVEAGAFTAKAQPEENDA